MDEPLGPGFFIFFQDNTGAGSSVTWASELETDDLEVIELLKILWTFIDG